MLKTDYLDALAGLPLDQILGNGRLIVALAVIAIVYGVSKILSIGRRDKRMPPGPPTLPILGNLHQIPVTGMYRKCVSSSSPGDNGRTIDELTCVKKVQRMGRAVWWSILTQNGVW
jgi:hypothetical protein